MTTGAEGAGFGSLFTGHPGPISRLTPFDGGSYTLVGTVGFPNLRAQIADHGATIQFRGCRVRSCWRHDHRFGHSEGVVMEHKGATPRIFISYSHDTDAHRERVLRLSERLRAGGIETRLDQYVAGTPAEKWPRWMLNQIDWAEFILLVCTKTYYRRFRGHEEPGKGKGVDWEGAVITQETYDARSAAIKFVPVLFDATDEDFIPEPVRGNNFYVLTSEKAYQKLYDFLLGQAGVEPGPIGEPKRKQRVRVKPLVFGEEGGGLGHTSQEKQEVQPQNVPEASGRLPDNSKSGIAPLPTEKGQRAMSSYYAIGVDVGTDKIAAGLVYFSEGHRPVVSDKKRVTHTEIGQKSLANKIADAIRAVLDSADKKKTEIARIGIGLPGQVNYHLQQLVFAPGLQIRNYPVTKIRQLIDFENVFIDNDVRCSTLAEMHFGSGKKHKHFVCIFVGGGIGSGIVIDGKIYRGSTFSGGEIGHMKIDVSESARLCTCGGKGCFEEYASARAIKRLARDLIFHVKDRNIDHPFRTLDAEKIIPEDIVSIIQANQSDDLCLNLVRKVAHYFGIGIANVANFINPDAIILGGGIINGFYDINCVRSAFDAAFKESVLDVCKNTPIFTAELEDHAAIIGAALLDGKL